MTIKKNKGLGRGLGALITTETIPGNEGRTILELPINDVNPNMQQPRKDFDDQKLQDLAASIKESGIIQPIIVTKFNEGYRIVAGERRWRASRIAGLKTIPAIVKELSETEVLQQALIENIQRQDLNVLEEAGALNRLIHEYDMTQEQLSRMVGRSRPAIANTLRLLNLPEEIQRLLREERLSSGHARTILAIGESEQQIKLADEIIRKELSVRETEKLVKLWLSPPAKRQKHEANEAYLLSIRTIEEEMSSKLSTKVKLKDKHNKGSIVIEYYSADDRERIIEELMKN